MNSKFECCEVTFEVTPPGHVHVQLLGVVASWALLIDQFLRAHRAQSSRYDYTALRPYFLASSARSRIGGVPLSRPRAAPIDR